MEATDALNNVVAHPESMAGSPANFSSPHSSSPKKISVDHQATVSSVASPTSETRDAEAKDDKRPSFEGKVDAVANSSGASPVAAAPAKPPTLGGDDSSTYAHYREEAEKIIEISPNGRYGKVLRCICVFVQLLNLFLLS